MQPKLTVGIPHLNRSALLKRAIDSLLYQSVPCKILVADQGHTEETAELMAEYADNPLVMHRLTEAKCLQSNWEAAAEMAMEDGAEYFAWVQDDDLVRYHYSERINMAFDAYSTANAWTARLNISDDGENGIWFAGNGPMIPMDILKNKPRVIPGHLMIPMAVFTSWALSPAVAFRCGDGFRDALAEAPRDCDLYTERTILASMGARGDQVCDPVTVGYWIMHEENESKRQNLASQPQQKEIFLNWIDDRLDEAKEWDTILLEWARMMPNTHLHAYIASMDGHESRYVNGVAEVLKLGLKEEITYEALRRLAKPTMVQPMVV
jgi:glycosyltransferase involved in cell wall biosynthesis